MKEEKRMNKKYGGKLISYFALMLIASVIIMLSVKIFTNISVGADNKEASVTVNLEKYVNFKLSDEIKGTLVQYNLKSAVLQEESEEYEIIKRSEVVFGANKIDGKYPYDVKVVVKSTEATNGKTENIQEDYQYNKATGEVTIKTSNENENGEPINSSLPNKEARDEYLILCYYETYTDENKERQLENKIALNYVFFEDDNINNYQTEFKQTVTEDIGKLTSIAYNTEDIYNGYIKSNIINRTKYNTQYKETQSVTISKKDAQEKLKIQEENSFVKVKQNENEEETIEDLGNNKKLVYKSTKVKKEEVTKLLGQEGIVEFLDKEGNVLGTINKDTQYQEDGTIVINYETEPESIVIKTSAVQKEGILNFENTKEIKDTMLNIIDVKIKTVGKIIGIKEEIEVANEEDEKTDAENKEEVKKDVEIFTNEFENIIEIKDSKTNVEMELSNVEWTNKQQNEVTFDIYANSNTIQGNMLKDTNIKIELPSQVEKVILGNSSAIYANGVELQNPYLETNEKGNIVIVANLTGAQTEYDQNTLGLITNVKIAATVILKKDIDSTVGNVNLTFANKYSLDGSTQVENKTKEVQIESYQEEPKVTEEETYFTFNRMAPVATIASDEPIEGLSLEVEPVRGDTVLKDGDTVYEGEFIKYNIKVTNTSDKKIDNIKVVGTVPEGTTYGELEADYYNYQGKYEYKFDESIKEKIIEVGTLEAGKSKNVFYEVKVVDLAEEGKKNILSAINAYAGESFAGKCEINNVIENAHASIFMDVKLDNGKDRWNYGVSIKGEQNKEVEVIVQFPKEFEFQYIGYNALLHDFEEYSVEELDNNKYKMKLKVDNTQNYYLEGVMDELKIDKNNNNFSVELTANATLNVDNVEYKSNENRLIYSYRNVSITMTSSNEGEEVKYGEEINYEITLENRGGNNLNISNSYITVLLKDYLPENVDPQTVTYDKWEENEETGEFTKTEVTKDISYDIYDENENKYPDINLSCLIPYKQVVKLNIKTKAGIVYEKTKIENSAVITSDETKIENGVETTNSVIGTKISNTVAHIIVPDKKDDIIIDDGNTDEDDNNDDNNTNTKDKYSISGIAWLDENEDGIRQTSEKVLNNITVRLVNLNNASKVQAKQVTDENGKYSFADLEKGKYIVFFEYDSENYSTTKYQVSGTSSSYNSDVTTKEIKISGNKTIVAITDILTVDASLQNIDIGIVKNKICDLKLDKYISRVSLKTASGENTKEYDNAKLAKVEVKAKEIEGATVVVEYKLVVTNEGELEATAYKIIDYLPEGFQFSSELNNSWIKNKDNELYNISLANKTIKPGESAEVTLILTKMLNENATGTYTNAAEIGEISNDLGRKDTDSVVGNKVDIEDDYSKAELIVAISTGLNVYIGFGITIIMIVAMIVLVTFKFNNAIILKLSKYFVFVFVFGSVIFIENVYSIGIQTFKYAELTNKYTVPNKAYFYFDGGVTGTKFHGYLYDSNKKEYYYASSYESGTLNSTGNQSEAEKNKNILATCIDQGIANQDISPVNGKYIREYNLYSSVVTTEKSADTNNEENSNYKFNKVNTVITSEEDGKYYIFGPFKYEYTRPNNLSELTYKLKIFNEDYTEIKNYSILNSNNKEITDVSESNSFKIKIPKSENVDNIKVFLTNISSAKIKSGILKKVNAKYTPKRGDGYQNVECVYKLSNYEEKTKKYVETVNWNAEIEYNLKIYKIDADTRETLEGAKFDIKNNKNKYVYALDDSIEKNKEYTYGGISDFKGEKLARVLTYDFETNANGYLTINGLVKGTYDVTEVGAPTGYYTDNETKSVTISDKESVLIFENETYEDLKIYKKSEVTNELLPGAKFKLQYSTNGTNYDKKYVVAETVRETGTDHYDAKEFKNWTAVESAATEFVTNGYGEINIKNLRQGTYLLTEIEAPEGYKTNGASIEITISKKSSMVDKIKSALEWYYLDEDNQSNLKNYWKYLNEDSNDEGDYSYLLGLMSLNSSAKMTEKFKDGISDISNVWSELDNYILSSEMFASGDKLFGMDTSYLPCKNFLSDIEKQEINVRIVAEWASEIENEDKEANALKAYFKYALGLYDYNGNVETDYDFILDRLVEIARGITVVEVENPQNTVNLTGYVFEDKDKDGIFETINKEEYMKGVKVSLVDKDGNVVKNNNQIEYTYITDTDGKYEFKYLEYGKLKDYRIKFEYNGMTYQTTPSSIKGEENTNKSVETERQSFNNKFETITRGEDGKDIAINSEDNTKTELKYIRSGYSSYTKYYEGMKRKIVGYEDGIEIYDCFKINSQIDTIINEDGTTIGKEETDEQGNNIITGLNLGLYEREMPDMSLTIDIISMNVSVNGQAHEYRKEKGTSYKLPIYEADLKEADFEGYVTYEIELKNQSKINTKINEIGYTYNDKYFELVEISHGSSGKIKPDEYDNENGSIKIKSPIKVDHDTTESINIKFKIKEDIQEELTSLMKHTSQINSYSTYDENYKLVYGGIDSDSKPKNYDDYDEDDSDDVPLQIYKATRQITGIIFEDNATDERLAKKERVGNGKYDDGEEKISNVTVMLVEAKKAEFDNEGKINLENQNPIIATIEDGNYKLENFSAGEYYIVYKWGEDEKYNVMDYKSTICTKEENTNTDWYKYDATKYSDAFDNYTLRKKIDSEELIGESMNSITNKMKIEIELDSNDNIYVKDNSYLKTRIVNIKNIDFGLIERPIQKVDIEKVVSSVKLTLANDVELINANVITGEDGIRKIEGDVQYVNYMQPDTNCPEGQVVLTVDNELIQGSELEIGYAINVANNSEIDYEDEMYYKYGKPSEGAEKVGLTVGNVYDYLDTIVSPSDENDWEVCTTDYISDDYKISYSMADSSILRWANSQEKEDGTRIENSGYKKMMKYYEISSKDWTEDTVIGLRKKIQGTKKILNYTGDNIVLKPEEYKVLTLTASKALAHTSDEITINNDSEITKVERTQKYGRSVKLETGIVFDRGEEVKITPPYGENRNYVEPIALGLISLVMLSGGIILIKKKVL